MATLIRDDGAEFVVQPYRELLSIKNFNILKREVRHLAQSNGSFVRLLKQPNGQYEVIFSHDPGFLLGENIWNYLGRPDNLLYCEELDADHVLLVVIRAGNVYVDAKIAKANLAVELETLMKSKHKFAIYVYGDVPLAKTADADHFALEAEQIKSFKQLNEAVFPLLETNTALELRTIEQALQEHSMGGSLLTATVLLAFVAIIMGIGVWKYQQNAAQQIAQKPQDPYQSFKMALMSPAPNKQLVNLAKDVDITYSMPGWTVTAVNYSGNNASFQVHSLGGNFAGLFHWAKAHEAQVNLSTQGALVAIINSDSHRASPNTIMSSKHVAARIIDDMMHVLPGKSVDINQISNHGVYKTINMTIRINRVAPEVLPLIGQSLVGLPVKLTGVNLKMNTGLLSGSINLTVLGS